MALIFIFHLKETIDQQKLGHLHCVLKSSDWLERDQSNREALHTQSGSGSNKGLIRNSVGKHPLLPDPDNLK